MCVGLEKFGFVFCVGLVVCDEFEEIGVNKLVVECGEGQEDVVVVQNIGLYLMGNEMYFCYFVEQVDCLIQKDWQQVVVCVGQGDFYVCISM